MSPRRALGLLAALVLVAPATALGALDCAPGPHCPMAAAMGDGLPCHGAAIQGDDCCVTAAGADATEAVAVTPPAALAADEAAPATRTVASPGAAPTASTPAPSPPLYRLFRALLI